MENRFKKQMENEGLLATLLQLSGTLLQVNESNQNAPNTNQAIEEIHKRTRSFESPVTALLDHINNSKEDTNVKLPPSSFFPFPDESQLEEDDEEDPDEENEDNKPGRKKRRQRTTPAQFEILESQFQVSQMPSSKVRLELAQKLNMKPRAVQVWFQNRRAKHKRLQALEERSNMSSQRIGMGGFSQIPSPGLSGQFSSQNLFPQANFSSSAVPLVPPNILQMYMMQNHVFSQSPSPLTTEMKHTNSNHANPLNSIPAVQPINNFIANQSLNNSPAKSGAFATEKALNSGNSRQNCEQIQNFSFSFTTPSSGERRLPVASEPISQVPKLPPIGHIFSMLQESKSSSTPPPTNTNNNSGNDSKVNQMKFGNGSHTENALESDLSSAANLLLQIPQVSEKQRNSAFSSSHMLHNAQSSSLNQIKF